MRGEYRGIFVIEENKTARWFDVNDFQDLINQLPPDRYRIKICKYSQRRSVEQNSFYWKMLSIASMEIGYETEELHEIMKFKFLRRTVISETSGEMLDYIKSTSKLTVTEFREYIDKCKRYLSNTLNIKFPTDFI